MTTTIVLVTFIILLVLSTIILSVWLYKVSYKQKLIKTKHEAANTEKYEAIKKKHDSLKSQIEILQQENALLIQKQNDIEISKMNELSLSFNKKYQKLIVENEKLSKELDDVLKKSIQQDDQLNVLANENKELLFEKNLAESKIKANENDKKNLFASFEKLTRENIELKVVLNEKDKENQELNQLLKNISNKNLNEIKTEMFSYFREKYQKELTDIFREEKEELMKKKDAEAKRIISLAIRNLCNSQSSSYVRDITSRTMKIKDLENWKGKIIGKKGNNQKVFEKELGVTFDFPHSSSNHDELCICNYNPENTLIAQIALQSLIEKNSFNIDSIRKEILQAKTKINDVLLEKGDEAIKKANITTQLPDTLKTMIGSLFLSYSYGQNMLDHSIEVAILAKEMAKHLNADPEIAALCGLFHDLGKASYHNHKNKDHIVEGLKLIQPFEAILPKEVLHTLEFHHDKEKIVDNIYTVIVVSADSISAGRPGIRNTSQQIVFERLSDIEKICREIDGVKDVKVLKSGHQLFLYADSEKVKDSDLDIIKKNLIKKIHDYKKIPGTINVTIYREVLNSFVISK